MSIEEKCQQSLIAIHNCSISDGRTVFLSGIDWTMNTNENWVITGTNGGGKSALASALGGSLEIIPDSIEKGSFYANMFKDSTVAVSFETAASLIEEERANDESEFIEGGVDIGRTPRKLISAVLKNGNSSVPLEEHHAVKLLGIGRILDRGLKYLSTGEIRRTLLARALASEPDLLVLDEPFEGLDSASRANIRTFLADVMHTSGAAANGEKVPHVLLMMDRFDYVPESVTHVLELSRGAIAFCGKASDYASLVAKRREAEKEQRERTMHQLREAVHTAQREGILQHTEEERAHCPELISMKNVVVGWDDKRVLDNVSWTVRAGEHWLIRGPNGSGKTTLLELITGDNSQVFCNDVSLFGNRRGSGETIWELKEKMGIVSYRLHVDYRNFGDMSTAGVVISGLHDSVGLYEQVGEYETLLAHSWLDLCGFANRYNEQFRTLSYGEQRAVLIARAAVKCPMLLILDEPCHGLDAASKSRILSVLQTIAESGITTLLHVTHDPDEVLPCEQHILELHPGETPMYQIITNEKPNVNA